MDLQLSGRAYFVTGGSRGIGKAIVQSLLDEGALVATCARGAAEQEISWANDAANLGERLLLQQGDVLDARCMEQLVGDAVQHFGRLDGIVANAGVGVGGGLLETPAEVWSEQFEIKVHSVLNVVRPAISALRDSDAGRVVVMNGVTAHVPDPLMAAVSAARAALASVMQSLAVAVADSSICVNAVNIGAIITDRQKDRHARATTDTPFDEWCVEEARRRGVLLARMGRPEEIAPIVALLLSPLSSYMTGGSIDVAGGIGTRL